MGDLSPLGKFGRCGHEFEFDLLLAQDRMRGGKRHFARLLLGANPDGAGAADQGEGIVADDLGGALEFELDGVVGKWADGAELIGDAQDDASGVGAVGNQAWCRPEAE